MAELLRAEDLQLDQEGAGGLHHMDLTVTAGASMGIVGLSGGGKTALAEILCGERPPQGGRVLAGSRTAGPELLRRWGTRITRDSGLLENLSVAENLLVLGRPAGHGIFCSQGKLRRLCGEFLAGFRLEHLLDIPPAAIPPADQYRLLLAGAAVRGKRLAVLDHVTDNAAPADQQSLAECIRQVCRLGVAVLCLTGRLDPILWQLDRVTVIRDGRRVKELARDSFTEPALRAYVSGYRPEQPPAAGGRRGGDTVFSIDGVPVREGGLLPILDTDGTAGGFIRRLEAACPRRMAVLSSEALSDRWIGELSAFDNLLLPVSRRLSGPCFHVSNSLLRVLRAECMEQTGLDPRRLDGPYARLTRMERFRLLLCREGLNRSPVYVFQQITAGADLRDREEMRRLAGTLPGIIFYISGDYGELAAFETGVTPLAEGRLGKESI